MPIKTIFTKPATLPLSPPPPPGPTHGARARISEWDTDADTISGKNVMFTPSPLTLLDFRSPVTFTTHHEESFDIPATLVDKKLMFTACVCNIHYIIDPNFFFLIPTRVVWRYPQSVNTSDWRHLHCACYWQYVCNVTETWPIYYTVLAVPARSDICRNTRPSGYVNRHATLLMT
jgi:hypothetical protein